MTCEDAIEVLLQFYKENAKNASMQYTFGFMDAVSVFRNMQNTTDFAYKTVIISR